MVRYGRISLLLLWTAWGSLAGTARAQSGVGVSPQTEPSAREASSSSSAASVVIFLMPDLEPDAQNQLREALLGQFALIRAHLVFEPAAPSPASLAEHMQQAQTLAKDRDAIAAFWIEAQPDGRWFVNMMDSQQERIVVRPLDAQGERRPAAVEAVAVMARESTRALIEGVPERPVAPNTPKPVPPAAQPAPPPPTPEPSEAPKSKLVRLWAGYAGSNDFTAAPNLPDQDPQWRNGIAFGVSWLGFAPLYGGLSYRWTPPITITRPLAFEIQRLPFAAYAGYRHELKRLELSAELGVSVEGLLRSSSQAADNQVSPSTAQYTTLIGLTPRLRAEFRLLPNLGLYAGGGIDILLNQFQYVLSHADQPTLKDPLLKANSVRPLAEAGIAFYL